MSEAHEDNDVASAADAAAPLLAEEPALTLRELKREYLLLRSAVIVSEFLPGKKYESQPRISSGWLRRVVSHAFTASRSQAWTP